jgi:catecholate siderophore receptor
VGLSTLPPGSFLSNPDISRNGPNAFPTLAGQNNPDSKTQRAINYEIGTKWQFFEKRLSATAAVFHTERRNVAMTNGTQLLGYGKQQVRGLELGLAGYITPQWAVFGGATLQKSKRIHSAAIDAALKAKTPGDFGSATSTSGDELAFTPRTQANLWATYSFPVGLTLGAGVQYVGSSYVGRPDNVDRVVKNGINGKLPSYTVFNAMAAYEVNKNLMLRLNVDNIFDKTYATSTNWSARRVQLGAPRSFILNADMSF